MKASNSFYDIMKSLYTLYITVTVNLGWVSINFFDTIFVSIQNDRYSIYHLIFIQDKKI